jgi:hypothetical protein
MNKARDSAVTEYMTEKKKTPGINPWRVFEAGWDAAKAEPVPREFPTHDEVRSSGWSGAGE